MLEFIERMNNTLFPYRFLNDPEYKVSRNLRPWDSMVRKLA